MNCTNTNASTHAVSTSLKHHTLGRELRQSDIHINASGLNLHPRVSMVSSLSTLSGNGERGVVTLLRMCGCPVARTCCAVGKAPVVHTHAYCLILLTVAHSHTVPRNGGGVLGGPVSTKCMHVRACPVCTKYYRNGSLQQRAPAVAGGRQSARAQ